MIVTPVTFAIVAGLFALYFLLLYLKEGRLLMSVSLFMMVLTTPGVYTGALLLLAVVLFVWRLHDSQPRVGRNEVAVVSRKGGVPVGGKHVHPKTRV